MRWRLWFGMYVCLCMMCKNGIRMYFVDIYCKVRVEARMWQEES
jgi:hypothetical protein